MFFKILLTEFRLILRNPFYWIVVVLYQAGVILTYYDYRGYSARHLAYSFYGSAFYVFLGLWAVLFFAAMARREDEGLRSILLSAPATNNQLIWGKFIGSILGLLPMALEIPACYIGLSVFRGMPWGEIWRDVPGITFLFMTPYLFAATVGFTAGSMVKSKLLHPGLILYWLATAFLSGGLFGHQETLFQFQGIWASWMVFSDIWGTFPLDKLLNSKLAFYIGLSVLLILAASAAAFPKREKINKITLAGILIVSITVVLGGANYIISKHKDQLQFEQEFTQYLVPLKQARAESEKVYRGREEDPPLPEQAAFAVKNYHIDLVYDAQNNASLGAELLVNLTVPNDTLMFTLRRNLGVKKVMVAGTKTSWKQAVFVRQGDGLVVTLPNGETTGLLRVKILYEGSIRHQRFLAQGLSITYYFVGKEGAVLPAYYGWYPMPGRWQLSRALAPDEERPKELLAVAESFPVVDYIGNVIAEMAPNQAPSDFYLRVTAPAGPQLFSNLDRLKVTGQGGKQVVEFVGKGKRGVLLVGGNLQQYERHGITFLVSPDYEAYLEPLAARLSERIKFFEKLVPGSTYPAKLLVMPGTYSNIQRSTPLQSSDHIIISEHSFARMMNPSENLDSLLAPALTYSIGTEPVISNFYLELLRPAWKTHDKKMFLESNRVAYDIMEFQQWLAFRAAYGQEKYMQGLENQLKGGNALLAERRAGRKANDSPVEFNEVLARLVELEKTKGLEGVRPVLSRLYVIAQQRSLTPADFWRVAGIGNP